MAELVKDDTAESENLDKFFKTRKTYIRVGLLIIGAFVVFLLFRKMKQDYVS